MVLLKWGCFWFFFMLMFWCEYLVWFLICLRFLWCGFGVNLCLVIKVLIFSRIHWDVFAFLVLFVLWIAYEYFNYNLVLCCGAFRSHIGLNPQNLVSLMEYGYSSLSTFDQWLQNVLLNIHFLLMMSFLFEVGYTVKVDSFEVYLTSKWCT